MRTPLEIEPMTTPKEVEDERVTWRVRTEPLMELIAEAVTDPCTGDQVMEELTRIRERGYSAADLGGLRDLLGEIWIKENAERIHILSEQTETAQNMSLGADFMCEICGYLTNWKSRLDTHMRARHPWR